MSARFGNKNFFTAHYEWIAAGVGLLALAGGAAFFAMSLGEDPDEAASGEASRIVQRRPKETGVKPLEMSAYLFALKVARSPVTVAEIGEKDASFLASERRVFCTKCKKAISGDVKACPACPFCGEKQQEEQKVVLDADGDGLPDEWERRYGLNPADAADAAADADSDGFTNAEEFLAKTDPTDAKDHPPYVDSLSIVLPLKETKMPFAFRQARKIPAGWRCEFVDPVRKDNYGRRGLVLTAIVGNEIASEDGKVKTGFKVKSYTPKTARRAFKGGEAKDGKGMTKEVDVSEVVVERVKDGKCVMLVVPQGKGLRLEPVDIQATLAYARGAVKNFDVVPGSELDLNGEKYKVLDVQAVGKGARVTIENELSAKKHVLEALEQATK